MGFGSLAGGTGARDFARTQAGIRIELKGMTDAMRRMESLPIKTAKVITKKALRHAAAPMRKALKQMAPRHKGPYRGQRASVRRRGELKRSVSSRVRMKPRGGQPPYVLIGPRGPNAGIAAILEFGTEDRYTGSRTRKRAGGRISVKSTGNPKLFRGKVLGTRWMTRAFDASNKKGIAAMERVFITDVEKEQGRG